MGGGRYVDTHTLKSQTVSSAPSAHENTLSSLQCYLREPHMLQTVTVLSARFEYKEHTQTKTSRSDRTRQQTPTARLKNTRNTDVIATVDTGCRTTGGKSGGRSSMSLPLIIEFQSGSLLQNKKYRSRYCKCS